MGTGSGIQLPPGLHLHSHPQVGLFLLGMASPPPFPSLPPPPPFHLPNDPPEPHSQDLTTGSTIGPGPCGLLTLHGESDGLAGLVIPILVINSLRVVAACVGSHR